MRVLFTFLFLLLLGATLPKDGLAQRLQKKVKFRRIEPSIGLSKSSITAILQDSKGFLWLGTNDGLNRFDGYDCRVYRNIENDTASLVKNIIQSVFEDSYGTLWVSTLNSGFHYYDRAADAFYRVPEFSQQHCQVFRIIEDFNHNLWIGGVADSHAFVAMLDYQTKVWKRFSLFPTNDGIYSMLQHSENEFWLGTRINGLYKWNYKTNVIEHYLHDPNNPNSLAGNYIEKMVKDDDGNLWIANRGSALCKFNTEKNIYRNFKAKLNESRTTIPNNNIMDICLDGHYLWIATENGGLSRMDMETEVVSNFYFDKNDPNTIINNSIWSLHKDRQGRLWIGTFAKGLCVLDAMEEKFSTLNLPLENDIVNAIIKDSKGRLWIGTEDGLWLIDKNGTHHFRNDPIIRNSLSNNPVLSIYEDSKHRIWIGVWNGGINLFNESAQNFIRYSAVPNQKGKLTDPNVFTIGESSKTGELLVGTFGGLNILKDEKTGVFEQMFEYPHEGDQLLLTLMEDSKLNIWVGAFSGLSLYSLESKKIKRLHIEKDTTKASDRVNCIFEDHTGVLWIGSNSGLYQMVSHTKFIVYTTKDGLPVNVVQGISEDSKGNLWVGTANGLTVFNRKTHAFRTYDESDGLPTSGLREKSFFQTVEGQFLIGGEGVHIFHPDSLISNPYAPPVYITDLKIFNESIRPKAKDGILKKDIAETKEVYLNFSDAFFSLQYVGINFTASYKNKYVYKLEGFNEDWVNAGTQRFATFTNLDPGTYTFKVKASNNDGLWNEEGASLIIHILPPWWKTWWFRTFLIFGLFGTAILISVMRTKSVRKVNRTLAETVAQKTKELQETNLALVKQEEVIKAKNIKLTEQGEELAAQNEELVQSQEEISAQRDLVSQQNENLEEEVVKRTQELVEYNQQLEQFAFISAHNLRAPVARILGLGQVLELFKNNPEEKEQIYPKLIYTAKELDGVVRDLNSILELKKNNQSFITNIDLATEISIIRGNLEQEIAMTRANITTDFAQIGNILTVKPYLDSILYNLISNAIKYRHPNRTPVIHLKTELYENEVCLVVSDNGLGIDVERYRDKLFSLYKRFHLHVEGKGMGLYLVKTQMTSLGGRIEVESEVNEGTIFRAYFKT